MRPPRELIQLEKKMNQTTQKIKHKKCCKEMVLMIVYIGEVAEVQLLGCSYQAIQTLPMKYMNDLEKGIRIHTQCRCRLKAELMVGWCSGSKTETFIKQMLTAI